MRYRPSVGRLLLEIFYGSDPSVTRSGGTVVIQVSQLARKLHVRPSRLRESLEWLIKYQLASSLEFGLRTATVVMEPTKLT